jgi:hypothetical protein
MGLNIRLYNITGFTNPFTLEYKSGKKSDATPFVRYPNGSTTYTQANSPIVFEGANFDTQYFFRFTDTVTGNFIIENITTHDSKYYDCYDNIDFRTTTSCNECEGQIPGHLYSGSVTLYDNVTPHGNHSSIVASTTNSYKIYTGTTIAIENASLIGSGTTNSSTGVIYTITGITQPTCFYVFVEHGDGHNRNATNKRQGGFEVKHICVCQKLTIAI